ncbi:hypothetical protein B0H13DRAFT_1866527 [Mycena leptocephala]|nr:hypothetical protein B0H13DRAFT_1866527 [Mycena leptocephala]
MVARHDRGAREHNLRRDDGLHAESDGVNEVDDVRGEGAWGEEEGGGYEALFGIYISVAEGKKGKERKGGHNTHLIINPIHPQWHTKRPKQLALPAPAALRVEEDGVYV